MLARILVIEDNQANLDLMRYLLEAFGYPVITAMDGKAGLEMVATHSPDLIVCDIQLPVVDGYEVSRRLQEDATSQSIPRIAVSALAMVGDRDRILASGFDGYIAKPIVPETFVEQLEAYLPEEWRTTDRPACLGSAATSDVAAPIQDRATILVIDDVPANLAVLHSVLAPSGYNVVSALSSAEAIRLLSSTSPDLIISDLHLPGENDYELLAHIKSHPVFRTVPFVIVSSTTRSESKKQQAVEYGAIRFLFRPIDPQTLLAEVEEVLATPSRT